MKLEMVVCIIIGIVMTAICILQPFAATAAAEDLIFFADDNFKSLGRPELAASVSNPSLAPGSEHLLRLDLANMGHLEEVVPINESGPSNDILLEITEEMHSSDALNIDAALGDVGPINVLSGPQNVGLLRAGNIIQVQFNISAKKSANGWYTLPLTLDYERQADVSVSGGRIFPLYEAERQNMAVRVFVSGNKDSLHISGIKSNLYPGGSENLWAAISNDAETTLHNCSARLLAPPLFHAESTDAFLGDLPPASVTAASFYVGVDPDASPGSYQLGCEIDCQEKSIIVPLPISLYKSSSFPESWMLLALGGLFTAGLAAFLLKMRRERIFRGKRRRS